MKHYDTFCSLLEHPQIQHMKEYGQHRNTNTYCHCRHVTLKSIWIVQCLRITVDMESLIRGAMLHDFYLYDIKAEGLTAWQHGHRHPETALKNAEISTCISVHSGSVSFHCAEPDRKEQGYPLS